MKTISIVRFSKLIVATFLFGQLVLANNVHAQNTVPELRITTPQVSVLDGKIQRDHWWNIAPETDPDDYVTEIAVGEKKTVKFFSGDQELTFQVDSGEKYPFNIVYGDKTFHMQIVGKTLPTRFKLAVNTEFAKMASTMISENNFDEATFAKLTETDGAIALKRKMRLENFDGLRDHLRRLASDQTSKQRAHFVSEQLNSSTGLYANIEAQTNALLKDYLPSDFVANITVVFIFGGNASGFAFTGDDNVYVNLANYTDSSSTEIAELVAHEVFHAIQSHIKSDLDVNQCFIPPGQNAPPSTACGQMRALQLMDSLLDEGTASLFNYDGAKHAQSKLGKRLAIEHKKNMLTIRSIITMFESLSYRLYFVPPIDDNDYERIYGLLFYTEPNDQLAYTLGYFMARTIEEKEGKMAIIDTLKHDRKDFILQYQAIAAKDGKLPKFSNAFIDFLKNKF